MKSITFIALSLVSFAAAISGAEVDRRQENQQDRIGRGVQNGSLTAAEGARLEAREARIHREVRRSRAHNNGKLTPAERERYDAQLDRQSRRIRAQKTDNDRVR